MGDTREQFDFSDLVKFRDAPRVFPQLNENQWQYLLSKRHKNGLAAATVDLGPRTKFLIKPRVREWLKSRIEEANGGRN